MPAARSRLPVAAVLIAATALLPSTGCIVAGTTLAIIAVGSIIRDAEVRALADELRGQDAAAADLRLGPREETLVVVADPDRKLLIYPIPEQGDDVHFTVEVRDGKISAVSKNRYGDPPEVLAKLRDDLLGQSPAECQQIEGFEEPLIVLRSVERNQELHLYDSSGLLEGTRYTVLRFDEHRACIEVHVITLEGSSQQGGVIKGRA
jgi:hypothetical protein